MRLVFPRLIRRDVQAALRHYAAEGGPNLADRFVTEFEFTIERIARHPTGFHFTPGGLRRANLARFPYHLLFDEDSAGVHILVLRHHRRRPNFGQRWT